MSALTLYPYMELTPLLDTEIGTGEEAAATNARGSHARMVAAQTMPAM